MGEGGIVLGPGDQDRLARRLKVDKAQFLTLYAVRHNGKHKIRTGPDGNCLFFRAGQGCTVHEDKPDICRAWPFFRGNLVDTISLAMAKDFCPGIRKDVTHAEFLAEGQRCLAEAGLEAKDPSCEAIALVPVGSACPNRG